MIIRVQRIIAPAALLLLIAAQVWVGVLWIQADGSLGDGVCCSFTAPVFEIMRADGTDQRGLAVVDLPARHGSLGLASARRAQAARQQS